MMSLVHHSEPVKISKTVNPAIKIYYREYIYKSKYVLTDH